VFQSAFCGTIDTHGEAAGRVRAYAPAVGFYPVCRVALTLLGWQQRDNGLQCKKAEILLSGKRNFAAFEEKVITFIHVAGAVSFDGFNRDFQVIQFKLVAWMWVVTHGVFIRAVSVSINL
jgi:hypothetical protein